MIKKDLTLILHNEYGLPLTYAGNIIDTVLDSIKSALKKNDRVDFRNFGSFSMRMSHGKIRPKFKASKNMLR